MAPTVTFFFTGVANSIRRAVKTEPTRLRDRQRRERERDQRLGKVATSYVHIRTARNARIDEVAVH